ncbi:MAG: M56 family metallopeptidase, partial [Bacteroides sp.]|nr:M56 family metallopeptidase [Bacteroides sp.]
YQLIICPEKISSFSWGKFIVLSQEDYDNYADEILLHEQMHLCYRHTLDLLWMEVLLVVQWFNPAVWLLMRDLRELHEFEADNGVLTYGIDATQYQLLLVKKSVGTRLYSMANGFNHSKLKNRINMMLKRRTNSWARLKVMLFVPVAAGTLMAFAQPEVRETVAQMVKSECTTIGMGVQDSIGYDEWELLEQYFQRKTEEAYPGKTADSWEWESLWQFFINYKDQLMLGNDRVQDTRQLRLRWADILRKRYREALEKNDRSKLPKLCVRYDNGSTVFAVRSSLRVIKEAYEQVHVEIRAQYGDAAPDSLLPIAVYKKVPRIYKNQAKYRTPSDVPLPIEVTFLRSDGKQLSETLKNLTLDELTQAVIRYKGKSQNMTISIKADDNVKMAVMNGAKEIIREIYSE